jgi:hypothetical protein
MKREAKLALSTALIAAVAIVGPAFCLNHWAIRQSLLAADRALPTKRSVIKVHTDHGVITVPGSADSWDEVEHAVFLADSIADMQVVNNEVPWRISIE